MCDRQVLAINGVVPAVMDVVFDRAGYVCPVTGVPDRVYSAALHGGNKTVQRQVCQLLQSADGRGDAFLNAVCTRICAARDWCASTVDARVEAVSSAPFHRDRTVHVPFPLSVRPELRLLQLLQLLCEWHDPPYQVQPAHAMTVDMQRVGWALLLGR